MLRRTFLLAIFLPTVARAHSFRHGNIAIGHAWALPRQLADGQVFFPMAIKGKERDELVAARSDVCTFIQFRENNRYDDPPLKSINLEPGKPVPMRPTATHLRLVGMTQPLKLGDRFKVILDFLNAGELEIEVYVGKTRRLTFKDGLGESVILGFPRPLGERKWPVRRSAAKTDGKVRGSKSFNCITGSPSSSQAPLGPRLLPAGEKENVFTLQKLGDPVPEDRQNLFFEP